MVRTAVRQNCAKNRPRISANGRYGATARAVSGVSSGAFKLRNGVAVAVNNKLAPDAKLAPKPTDD